MFYIYANPNPWQAFILEPIPAPFQETCPKPTPLWSGRVKSLPEWVIFLSLFWPLLWLNKNSSIEASTQKKKAFDEIIASIFWSTKRWGKDRWWEFQDFNNFQQHLLIYFKLHLRTRVIFY